MVDANLVVAGTAAVMLHKILGPAAAELGEDIRRMYKAGAEKLLAATHRKIENPEDGKQANLRVTNDVLWHGACTDDEVCAEYFGGVLASCRSEDGKDDSNIQFSSVIKSLSSSQLRLHYVIYNVLNKSLVAKQVAMNVAQHSEIEGREIWLSALELFETHQVQLDTDFTALHQQGLLSKYEWQTTETGPRPGQYCRAKPTSFGVLLYATAHNLKSKWLQFPFIDFGNFESIPSPRYFGTTIDELNNALNEGDI